MSLELQAEEVPLPLVPNSSPFPLRPLEESLSVYHIAVNNLKESGVTVGGKHFTMNPYITTSDLNMYGFYLPVIE